MQASYQDEKFLQKIRGDHRLESIGESPTSNEIDSDSKVNMGEMFHMSQKSRQFQKALFNTDQISSNTDLSSKDKSINKTPT